MRNSVRIFVVAAFVVAVVFLSQRQQRNATAVSEQQNAVVSSPTSYATAVPSDTPTITPVPTETPFPSTATPIVIVIEPTVNPRLSVDIQLPVVNVEPETIAFHPVLKNVIQALDYESDAKVAGTVLEGELTNLGDIPELSDLGPPCTAGHYSWLTGYNWMEHETHTAIDIACNDMLVAAPTNGVVYAILWEAEAYEHNSSGMNVLTIAKIPDSYNMPGWIIFGNGHMQQDVDVSVGQKVQAGQVLGKIGATGNARGAHNHYYALWLKTDGTTEFLNPNNWSAIGTR